MVEGREAAGFAHIGAVVELLDDVLVAVFFIGCGCFPVRFCGVGRNPTASVLVEGFFVKQGAFGEVDSVELGEGPALEIGGLDGAMGSANPVLPLIALGGDGAHGGPLACQGGGETARHPGLSGDARAVMGRFDGLFARLTEGCGAA